MEPFKNLLGPTAAARIAAALTRSYPAFDGQRFLAGLPRQLAPLELKARSLFIYERLKTCLPADPPTAFAILAAALSTGEDDKVGLSGFEVWPLTEFVAREGLSHFEASMATLAAMTQVFTAEFAIRPFLIHHEDATLQQLALWTQHENEHLRRLASEGSRPLLPWGLRLVAFVKDPLKTWPLLEALKDDPSAYVRKSVANHINDHAKHHGDWVVERLKGWTKGSSEDRRWIIRHGTRTLIKQGHADALTLQGVRHDAVQLVRQRLITPRIRLGEKLQVEVTVKNGSKKTTLAIVDHELTLKGSRAKARRKVLKGKTLQLAAGESRTLLLSFTIKEVTTRRYYAGTQTWNAIVNGVATKPISFHLSLPSSR